MVNLQLIDDWPVEHASAAVVSSDGSVLGTYGDQNRVYPLASVTKMLTAYAVLIAVEEEAVTLDEPAGPEGSTVRHLLAHASGLAMSEDKTLGQPGGRRVYSNIGFEYLAAHVAEQSGFRFAEYVQEGLVDPLGMADTVIEGSPAAGASSTVADLTRFAAELQDPTLLHASTVAEATSVAFPGLDGVLPGFGRQQPNDWGLGFEIRDGKNPHWTGGSSSPQTYGHFGQSGTFIWVDPPAALACVVLTDRNFDTWAAKRWPALTDAVLASAGASTYSRPT
ncbi:MAG TPA: serine hydrolase domain-containing protein [Jiangellaceae bacterium]|nr:serine hydrolase domain-containing protein [Jiangellaceae bacterium]